MDSLHRVVAAVSDAVWGPWTIFLLFGTGLFLTLRFRVVQLTRFRQAAASLVPKAQAGAKGVLSPFQAFMTGLAGSVGTGNIAGVATAVVAGGPGAVFWIWCYGFFATAIKFAEAALGVRYRRAGEGRFGPGRCTICRTAWGRPSWPGFTA